MELHTNISSLLKAVYLSRLRLTRLLLEGGAYINESNKQGETPLMVACKTQHIDSQSVDKVKMVRYLLESGADPNIQDKCGRTALMHACMEGAGVEVVTLLLNSGAEPGLEDHTGSSALVYAVHANDEAVLRTLLDACKAQGKEVIIITTDKLPSGRHMTKQYLNVPPPLELEDGQPGPPTSPSDIELCTLPQPATHPRSQRSIFTVGDHQQFNGATPQPGSPSRRAGMVHCGLARVQQLQRLHSEPWLKIPPSLLEEHGKASPLTKVMADITPEEESSITYSRRYSRVPTSNSNSTITKNSASLSTTLEHVDNIDQRCGRKDSWLCWNMSSDNISLARSQPDLHRSSVPGGILMDKHNVSLPGRVASSLRSIVLSRSIGVDHYGSDSQLSQYNGSPPEDFKRHPNKRVPISCSSSIQCTSHDSLETHPSMQERRGCGALFNTHSSHSRPGCLPPLNPHMPLPQIEVSSVDVSPTGILSKTTLGFSTFAPSTPHFPKGLKGRRTLTRRHSMHTDHIKQLGNFKEIFGH